MGFQFHRRHNLFPSNRFIPTTPFILTRRLATLVIRPAAYRDNLIRPKYLFFQPIKAFSPDSISTEATKAAQIREMLH